MHLIVRYNHQKMTKNHLTNTYTLLTPEGYIHFIILHLIRMKHCVIVNLFRNILIEINNPNLKVPST
jgi:hypothetical protein